MNTTRMLAIALPMMLLMACGGGGGGTAAVAPTPMNMPDPMNPPTTTPPTDGGGTPNPLANLANFESSTGHSTIQMVSEIATNSNVDLLTSSVAEVGNFGSEENTNCIPSRNVCSVPRLPNDDPTASLRFEIGQSVVSRVRDVSLIPQASAYFFGDYTSMVTAGVSNSNVTLARGNLMGTRVSDERGMSVAGAPIEVQSFAGWLDGSIFGTTQISAGTSGSEEYRFISYLAGVPATDNPSSTGSATWEGAAVASIKADRTFILGDATVTVNFTDTNVDLMFDDWRGLDNQAVSGMSAISYEDLTLTGGAFEGSGNDQVQGRFYGTDHAEVGGFFNTADVTGAFGGTRE